MVGRAVAWEPPDWMGLAACRTTSDPDVFFPDSARYVRMTASAKEICETCAVRIECTLYALRIKPKYGIWGGLTVKELHNLEARIRRIDNGKA